MRFLKKQLSGWYIVLIIGVAAMAIPVNSRVSSTAKAVVKERQAYLDLQRTAETKMRTTNTARPNTARKVKLPPA